jgi:hypothetical protein
MGAAAWTPTRKTCSCIQLSSIQSPWVVGASRQSVPRRLFVVSSISYGSSPFPSPIYIHSGASESFLSAFGRSREEPNSHSTLSLHRSIAHCASFSTLLSPPCSRSAILLLLRLLSRIFRFKRHGFPQLALLFQLLLCVPPGNHIQYVRPSNYFVPRMILIPYLHPLWRS